MQRKNVNLNLFLRIPKQVYAIEQIKNLKYSAVFSTFSNNKCIFDQKRIYLVTFSKYTIDSNNKSAPN